MNNIKLITNSTCAVVKVVTRNRKNNFIDEDRYFIELSEKEKNIMTHALFSLKSGEWLRHRNNIFCSKIRKDLNKTWSKDYAIISVEVISLL